MPDEPTLGEVSRRLDRIDEWRTERAVSLSTYLAERTHDRDEVSQLRRELVDFRSEISNLRHEVKAVSDGVARTFRLATTGVLSPIIVGIVLWLITRTP